MNNYNVRSQEQHVALEQHFSPLQGHVHVLELVQPFAEGQETEASPELTTHTPERHPHDKFAHLLHELRIVTVVADGELSQGLELQKLDAQFVRENLSYTGVTKEVRRPVPFTVQGFIRVLFIEQSRREGQALWTDRITSTLLMLLEPQKRANLSWISLWNSTSALLKLFMKIISRFGNLLWQSLNFYRHCLSMAQTSSTRVSWSASLIRLINLERRLLREKHMATLHLPLLFLSMLSETTDRGWVQKGMFLSFQGAILNLVVMMPKCRNTVTSFRVSSLQLMSLSSTTSYITSCLTRVSLISLFRIDWMSGVMIRQRASVLGMKWEMLNYSALQTLICSCIWLETLSRDVMNAFTLALDSLKQMQICRVGNSSKGIQKLDRQYSLQEERVTGKIMLFRAFSMFCMEMNPGSTNIAGIYWDLGEMVMFHALNISQEVVRIRSQQLLSRHASSYPIWGCTVTGLRWFLSTTSLPLKWIRLLSAVFSTLTTSCLQQNFPFMMSMRISSFKLSLSFYITNTSGIMNSPFCPFYLNNVSLMPGIQLPCLLNCSQKGLQQLLRILHIKKVVFSMILTTRLLSSSSFSSSATTPWTILTYTSSPLSNIILQCSLCVHSEARKNMPPAPIRLGSSYLRWRTICSVSSPVTEGWLSKWYIWMEVGWNIRWNRLDFSNTIGPQLLNMNFIQSFVSKVMGYVMKSEEPKLMSVQEKKDILRSSKMFRMSAMHDALKTRKVRDVVQNQQVEGGDDNTLNQTFGQSKPQPVPKLPEPEPTTLEQQQRKLIQQFDALTLQSIPETLLLLEHTRPLLESELKSLRSSKSDYQIQSGKSRLIDSKLLDRFKIDVTLPLYNNEREYPQLTVHHYANIEYIFKNMANDSSKLPRTNPVEEISYRTFCTLRESEWLNDEVINTYIAMISRELQLDNDNQFILVNTFFTVAVSKKSPNIMERLATKNKITRQTKLLVPIHWNKIHWFFVLIVQGVIRIYDSMKNEGNLPECLIQFCRHLHGNARVEVEKFPRQRGGQDCGVFMLCGLKETAFDLGGWGFRQENIVSKRLGIAKDILNGEISKRKPFRPATSQAQL